MGGKTNANDTAAKFGSLEVSVLLIFTSLLSLFSGVFINGKMYKKNNEHKTTAELNEIIANYNYIIENYYEDVDKNKIVKGAVKGMVESLGDKYTSFLDLEDNENLNIQLKGSFIGVGVEVVNFNEEIIVVKVIEDSPASVAGLKAGDVILEVDGEDLQGKKTNEFVELVKDKAEKFNVLIKRGDSKLTKKLYKDKIILKSVTSNIFDLTDKKIGYLDVTLFASNTFEQFSNKLKELEEAEIDSLIIDVRWNAGGHLSSVEDILSLFLDDKHVIYQTESKNDKKKVYSKGMETKKYPIILLSNEESASASELLMGALRDQLNAKIVGMPSFGKGSVQELNTLTSSDKYKITTKKWLTPNGDFIDKVGIEPDVKVEQGLDYFIDFKEGNDLQLQKAIEILSSP